MNTMLEGIIPGDPFFDAEKGNFIWLPDTPDITNGFGTLHPDLKEWCLEHAPNAQWTYRRGTGFRGETVTKVLFKFETEKQLLYFKMRWQN